MSSKENLVKHPETETEEVEEIVDDEDDIVLDIDDDEDDDTKSVSSSSAAKNKMFKFMGIILAITILLLIIVAVVVVVILLYDTTNNMNQDIIDADKSSTEVIQDATYDALETTKDDNSTLSFGFTEYSMNELLYSLTKGLSEQIQVLEIKGVYSEYNEDGSFTLNAPLELYSFKLGRYLQRCRGCVHGHERAFGLHGTDCRVHIHGQ